VYHQTIHQQAVITGETLKGLNQSRESKQPQDCCEKSHDSNRDNCNSKLRLTQLNAFTEPSKLTAKLT